MNDIKAIETSYKGFRFRSRTEARWAVFFDAIGIEWKYEHEGYNLGDEGLYLPDFWLPGTGTTPGLPVFAEVKGQEFSVKEINRCRLLARRSGYSVFMLDGMPDVRSYRVETPAGLLVEQVFRPDSQQVVAEAVAQARSARFEHGETPEIQTIDAASHREYTADPRVVELDARIVEIDRAIPLADGKEKDRLIEEKRGLIKDLLGVTGKHYKTFRKRR